MEIVNCISTGYERLVSIFLKGKLVVCTVESYDKYLKEGCIDSSLIGVFKEPVNFRLKYAFINDKEFSNGFFQPIENSPSTILTGKVKFSENNEKVVISNDFLGELIIEFENSVCVKDNSLISIRGELQLEIQ
ncbi:hypothetical protein [Pseudomonas sp. MAG002Y]|uniref:hypothetical protein n=1 Tax=Pseudomonas sp. MAG002Y TaxID=2678690 RepID=UPI001C60D6CD|nr:hypothetical protein [Pseudomonas sp. MAG002Y]MBW5412526.1 hypothetical protein [Pseudomonas sp. MAG002Y]